MFYRFRVIARSFVRSHLSNENWLAGHLDWKQIPIQVKSSGCLFQDDPLTSALSGMMQGRSCS